MSFLRPEPNQRCVVLHESTQFVNSLYTVIEYKGSARMALCLCDADSLTIIDTVQENYPQAVLLFVLCTKHYPFGNDPLYDNVVVRDIDLCSNGEWESSVHI